jgi:hypothetical protein
VTLEGLREVLVGESPDGVCWTVRAGPDSDGGFYTWIRRSHGSAISESGLGGEALPPGQLINFWIGQADGTPQGSTRRGSTTRRLPSGVGKESCNRGLPADSS